MNTTLNITTLIINKSEFETFNTGCFEEVTKCMNACSNFKVSIASNIFSRFRIGFIILCLLVLYQIFIKYNKPKYSQSEFYMKYIDYRIDYMIMILAVSLIGFTLIY